VARYRQKAGEEVPSSEQYLFHSPGPSLGFIYAETQPRGERCVHDRSRRNKAAVEEIEGPVKANAYDASTNLFGVGLVSLMSGRSGIVVPLRTGDSMLFDERGRL
jgi:hypothetical protein